MYLYRFKSILTTYVPGMKLFASITHIYLLNEVGSVLRAFVNYLVYKSTLKQVVIETV